MICLIYPVINRTHLSETSIWIIGFSKVKQIPLVKIRHTLFWLGYFVPVVFWHCGILTRHWNYWVNALALMRFFVLRSYHCNTFYEKLKTDDSDTLRYIEIIYFFQAFNKVMNPENPVFQYSSYFLKTVTGNRRKLDIKITCTWKSWCYLCIGMRREALWWHWGCCWLQLWVYLTNCRYLSGSTSERSPLLLRTADVQLHGPSQTHHLCTK